MIGVILATHNGADTIEQTLQALCDISQPQGGWQLIVVNNASTDETSHIIHRFSSHLPLRYVEEPNLGKANAVNAGIAHACGDLTVFTDDDVIPDHNWLCEWRRVADQHPEIDIFGGSIVPAFEASPPAWLRETNWMLMLYAATTPTLAEGAFPANAAEVFGPNMAVRSKVLEAGYRFDPRLMKGATGLIGDETDFVIRAASGGALLGFAPTARVRHIVNRSQVTWRWMLRRFYRHGRTLYYCETASRIAAFPCIAGIPRYLFRRIAEQVLLLPVALASGKKKRIMALLRTIAYDLGAAYQAKLMAKERA